MWIGLYRVSLQLIATGFSRLLLEVSAGMLQPYCHDFSVNMGPWGGREGRGVGGQQGVRGRGGGLEGGGGAGSSTHIAHMKLCKAKAAR